ncbi:putative transporter [Paludibacter sp. 221]|uniref:putative transporter n=1 Tax=Paludibacter sp. 221 TaxID=2302939 RepID=UPI0013D5ECB2|nr:putative transporter [Paludibacter sp. 221]NDV46796.1 putative transporter [Paludibacter sp. 221]
MDWLVSLFTGDGIAHTILLYALVISVGVMLGKIKVFGISLGVTFVLFVGLFVGHLGLTVNHMLLDFIKEFGLILFVFSIGLQVGPGFFSSFKKGGMKLNFMAVSIVLLGVATTIAIYYILSGRIPMAMMVGILSGATTNTPGLGAAQEALKQLFDAGQISEIPQIALGYAVAYPLGVVGIILALILVRLIFKVNFDDENKQIEAENNTSTIQPEQLTIRITNPALDGRKLYDVKKLVEKKFVISRLKRGDNYFIPQADTELHVGDILLIVTGQCDEEAICAFIGEPDEVDWSGSEQRMVSRRIIITQSKINGKTLGSLRLRSVYGVNVTRVNRSGIDLLAAPNLTLQMGDRVMVVGELEAIEKVEKFLGNTLKRLNEPHIITIFIGIFLGIILGSIPFAFPGIPMPVRLGLAGGPLIVAILIGRFGYKAKLITYTTLSANYMLREIGICLFLASVGLGAGGQFVETVISGDGLLWVACGFLITIIPLLIVGICGRKFLKLNYFTLMGLIAGSTTDPPALAYANSVAGNDAPAVAYSTVYPLTMFMRVLTAQLLILIFV